MEIHRKDLCAFLVRAKRATYAGGGPESEASRPKAHDLHYAEADGAWRYIDSYFGGEQFVGEEAVWKDGEPVWAMNYSGRVFGEGFDGAFLKSALRSVPEEMPARGPIEYQEGSNLYCNTLAGDMTWFFGREEIYKNGVSIYECVYHGGFIR